MGEHDMKLIGMLDSPYVRRTAISLAQMGVPFTLDQLSVFGDFDTVARVNPTVKVPTLITDDGVALSELGLIIDFVRRQRARTQSDPDPVPDPLLDAAAVRALGLALTVAEKSLQVVYERALRPAERQHAPWLERVTTQLLGGLAALEAHYAGAGLGAPPPLSPADIMTAVTWRFTQANIADLVRAADHPALAALSARLEQTAAFRAYPYPGDPS